MADVVHMRWDERSWLETETPGIEYALLRPQADGGATILLHFEKGVIGAAHTHPGGEELFVVSGDITIGEERLKAGDYLYTPPGADHDAIAAEETVLMLNLPKLPVFL